MTHVLLDFAIVGEPKSGTTALHAYLAGHAGIALASRKEPGFWSPDWPRLERVEHLADYEALWDASAEGRLRGEASTNYLASQVAVPAILREHAHARLIAMIRNPVDMAASLHSELLATYQEDVRDFEAAWRLQLRRAGGDALPPECAGGEVLQYQQMCAVGDHLERFFANVPEPQRLVVLFDDLSRNAGEQYARVLEFLGLEDDGRRRFTPVRTNRNLRSPRLARVHRSMPRRLGRLYGPARTIARSVGVSPSLLVNRLNVEHAPRPPLRPSFRAELVSVFAPQVERVSRLLDRDLSHWG